MRRSATTPLIDPFRNTLHSIDKIKYYLLVFPIILLLSGCGGSDGGNTVPTVDLTVRLLDKLSGLSPSGQSVLITDGGKIDFTCFQSLSDQLDPDARCSTVAPGSTLESRGIVFGSLPTTRTYTLTHIDTSGSPGATCQVEILKTTSLVAQTPCTSNDTANSVTMTLNSGTTP